VFFSFQPLRVMHIVEDFYADLKLPQTEVKPRERITPKLDETDRKLLNTMSEDSSQSYVAIAGKLGTSIDVVRYRLKQLKGVLLGFTADVSLRQLGYTEYMYILQLKNLSAEKIQSLKKVISTHPNINVCHIRCSLFFCGIYMCVQDSGWHRRIVAAIAEEFCEHYRASELLYCQGTSEV